MAGEFRCRACGKLIEINAGPVGRLFCPHCRAKVAVLRPIASSPGPDARYGAALADQAAREGGEPPGDPPAARIMPWVVSLCLHVGLAMIMMMVAMIVLQAPVDPSVVVPNLGRFDLNPSVQFMNAPRQATDSSSLPESAQRRGREAADSLAAPGETREAIPLIGIAGRAGSDVGLGRGGGYDRVGPRGVFRRTNAHHVVFVVDRSGSMIDTFDYVRKEMLRSIADLRPPQDFHVILFAAGLPIENAAKRLVPAEFVHKEQVAEFLQSVRAQGQTDPVPALRRAFQVLAEANDKPGKVIHLLTDAVFPDNDRVLALIRRMNARKDVHIFPILYGHSRPEAVAVMKRIAGENSGEFRYVSPDE